MEFAKMDAMNEKKLNAYLEWTQSEDDLSFKEWAEFELEACLDLDLLEEVAFYREVLNDLA